MNNQLTELLMQREQELQAELSAVQVLLGRQTLQLPQAPEAKHTEIQQVVKKKTGNVRFTDEEKQAILARVEAARNSESLSKACRNEGITDTTYYNWRKQFPSSTPKKGVKYVDTNQPIF